MKKVYEYYGHMGEEDDRFDIAYWQAQGPMAIFQAAAEMVRDWQILRY